MNLKFKKAKVPTIGRLKEVLKYTENHVCVIGIWDSDGVKSSPHITYRELAIVHEYGLEGKIPARPFVAPAVEKKGKECLDMYKENIHQFLKGILPIDFLYDAPATMMVQAIQDEFGSPDMAPLSKATIKLRTKGSGKGVPKPLLDHGNLQSSVMYEVVKLEELDNFVAA